MSESRRPNPPALAPYVPPDVQVVRVDPVTELLQNTQCNFEPGFCSNPCG